MSVEMARTCCIAVRDFKRGSLVDRRGERPILLMKVGAAANGFGFRVMLVLLHTCSFYRGYNPGQRGIECRHQEKATRRTAHGVRW